MPQADDWPESSLRPRDSSAKHLNEEVFCIQLGLQYCGSLWHQTLDIQWSEYPTTGDVMITSGYEDAETFEMKVMTLYAVNYYRSLSEINFEICINNSIGQI